jgi:subtilisin family serine protease
MVETNRRAFLTVSGTVLGGIAAGATVTGAETSTRFLIDLREVDRGDVPDDVEIIHDLDRIDVLAARGDPEAIPGAASTIPDVAVYQDGISPTGGPVQEVAATGRENKGPAWDSGAPTYTELQWDKREQRVGDLTERPDNQRVVHDTTKGEDARIAIVDTGVYDDHPDLAVNGDLSENFTTDEYDWRPNGAGDHGTHVAGIAAGANANEVGILGTAPEAEILSMRVFSGVEGATGDVLAALVASADRGCDVANISLGYPYPYVDPEEYPWLLAIKEMYERVAAYGHENDMSIVNSTGNDSLDMSPEGILSLPTEAEGIFGVSATGPIGYLWDDNLESREDISLKTLEDPIASPAFYTNYGHGVDVSAAGGDADLEAIANGVPGWYYDLVFSTIVQYDDDGNPVPGYGWKAGTSMSAPQVTGAYALVRSLRPDASADEVEELIRETAGDAPGGELYHGAGHLDLRRLVREAAKGGDGKGGVPP